MVWAGGAGPGEGKTPANGASEKGGLCSFFHPGKLGKTASALALGSRHRQQLILLPPYFFALIEMAAR
jgi:hypothetical protein